MIKGLGADIRPKPLGSAGMGVLNIELFTFSIYIYYQHSNQNTKLLSL